MQRFLVRWVSRARLFFRKDLPPRWEHIGEKLPPYRTETIAVIANVNVRFLHDFLSKLLLTFSVAGLILTGGILGVEQGANFVRIKIRGFAKDQHGADSQIYDAFDLRFPQVENGAIFISTDIIKSPHQVRYGLSEQEPALCVGSHPTEKCEEGKCTANKWTKHGFISDNTYCDQPTGYCMVNAWCNETTRRAGFPSEDECSRNCPYCFSEVALDSYGKVGCGEILPIKGHENDKNPDYLCEPDADGNPHICYNRVKTYKTSFQYARCADVYQTTNISYNPDQTKLIIQGIEEWPIEFDIFMTFAKYWVSRSVADEYFKDLNTWTISELLAKVDTTYDDIKETGIIIAANAMFECTIFSSYCEASWQFTRLDENNEGFGLVHRLYIPGVSLFGALKSRETRYILKARGIRLLTSVSSNMYVPDPMAALIAIGGVAGIMGLSTTVTEFFMKFATKKHKFYAEHMELKYEDYVKHEKKQLQESFDVAIQKHMKLLYEEEKQMKRMMNVQEEHSENSVRF